MQYQHGLPVLPRLEHGPCCRKEAVRSFEASVDGVQCIAHYLLSPEALDEECRQLGKLRHPNVLQHLGVYHCNCEVGHAIVTEQLHSCLDLYLAADPHDESLPVSVKLSILRDVARGLKYLHSQTPPITHRQLFAENVHLTLDMRAKIAVVGVSMPFDVERVRCSEAVAYLPPEALEDNAKPYCNTSWDIYSFGVLAIYTTTHKLPPKANALTGLIDGMGMGKDHPLHNVVYGCLKSYPGTGRKPIDAVYRELDDLCKHYPYTNSQVFTCVL